MTPALQVILTVENHGGTLTVEGENLVIVPASAGLPVLDSLRLHKPEIIALIQSRSTDDDVLGVWLLDRCCFDDRCASMPGALYLDFVRWCVSRSLPAPDSRQAFLKTLYKEGFVTTTAGYVHGLILREDFDAILGKSL